MTYSITTNDRGDYVASENDVPFMAYLHLHWALRNIWISAVEYPVDRKVVYQFGSECTTCGFNAERNSEFCSDGCKQAWDRVTEDMKRNGGAR